ncbi:MULTISPECIES: aspartate aminotransferase family protein [Sphingobacterium]|jgi:acetylornithine aminotransferase|uniref:Aspartate aminotransferase family protein n=2 Tax=Sphingobacterium multivorum TaxID=28454 RepID=A0A654BQX9_SPHMU|nr:MULTISPECIES: aminotransferase class III-fold pyridoxal phosphate-dependent enzyme [Sphingobacterium]HBI88714.1 aspartate aminotransferase family protein [Sphingobacterium sp.]MDF2853909.1 aspartate aminotransferase family protein [Sphingobacterium multivorum]OJZ03394.1 MAG: aspartate aminotransferase family protein [Sphingobacterium sp. 40-24]QQT43930.1 aspartate aminotransferase family protein [Sphingobacterium multivorum]QQT63318.1 aspartate aminotransferase family protein [Sphingobacter
MKPFDVYPINPINIVKANGSTVWDAEGNAYLDLYGGHAVISIGHTHPHYVQRITEQLNRIAFYSNSVEIPIQRELARLLGEVSGKVDYDLFLCNSGAEANENALKLASFYNKRKKVIAFSKAFHGRTSLAVAATDNPSIVAPVNETDNIVFLPFNDEEALTSAFASYGEEISSVIVESIQGVGGIREASVSFLRLIRSLCDQYNAVFIADEVQCGYGRTGLFYAQDYSGVEADIYTMAKGMGNGFPIGAISISPKFKATYGSLGTTFGGNHLACAAALAVLEVIQQDQLMENAAQVGTYLINELKQIEEIIEVRGRGLMIGIELPASLGHVKKDLLLKNRIFTGEAKPFVIRLLPALNMTKEHADQFLSALKEHVKAVTVA